MYIRQLLGNSEQFKKRATVRLKEYMVKNFAMDDERLKGNCGGNYWKELLARIRGIRSSELPESTIEDVKKLLRFVTT